jgi:hypothetical protein
VAEGAYFRDMTYFGMNERVQLLHEFAGLAAGTEGIICDFRFEDGEAYIVRFGLEEREVGEDDLAPSSQAARLDARSEATVRLGRLPAVGSR